MFPLILLIQVRDHYVLLLYKMIFEVLLYIALTLIFCTFIGYPIVLSMFSRKQYIIDDQFMPTVSMIISAHNEEKHIESKLDNTLKLVYPSGKLQIIVVNDGSTDKTEEIVKSFEGIKLINLTHQGKTIAQNSGVKEATGNIVVFSDANNLYHLDAIKKLVAPFADDRIGVVCGQLKYNQGSVAESRYWSFEFMLKKLESRRGSLLGANGSIYALRKENYVPLPEDVISDLIEPIKIFGNGKDVIFESNAIATEESPGEILDRKRRIILRSLVSIKEISNLLNPFRSRNIFFQFLFHKLLRWCLPLFLLSILVLSLILAGNSNLYRILLITQIAFYTAGWIIHPARYFMLVNLASLLAVIDWLTGRRQNTWDVVR